MSLLNRIQSKNEQERGDKTGQTKNEETLPAASKPEIHGPLLEQRSKETHQERTKTIQDSKEQELKNILHKKILQDMKNNEVEEIIPKLEGMSIEIIKEDESFEGRSIEKKLSMILSMI